MARSTRTRAAGLRVATRRIQSDGDELMGRVGRDASELSTQWRGKILRQLKRLERRLKEVARVVPSLQRRSASAATVG